MTEAASPRAIAKAAGERTYLRGNPCTHGHTGPFYTSSGGCVECTRARTQIDKKAIKLRKRQARLKKQEAKLMEKTKPARRAPDAKPNTPSEVSPVTVLRKIEADEAKLARQREAVARRIEAAKAPAEKEESVGDIVNRLEARDRAKPKATVSHIGVDFKLPPGAEDNRYAVAPEDGRSRPVAEVTLLWTIHRLMSQLEEGTGDVAATAAKLDARWHDLRMMYRAEFNETDVSVRVA